MIVRQDKTITGTIGGGLLEARVLETAMTVFSERKACIKRYDLSGLDLETIDMTCGGAVEVLVDYIDADDPAYLQIYRSMSHYLVQGKLSRLVTLIPDRPGEEASRKQLLIEQDGSVTGMIQCDYDLLQQLSRRTNRYDIFTILENRRVIMETIGDSGTAFIIGAGHVAQKLVPLLKPVNFRTVVMDDRREFANRDRFPVADEIVVLDDFEAVFKHFMIDRTSYIVIVTRGHLHDGTVLEQALNAHAGYIGMIGSRIKRDRIYDMLHKRGLSNNAIARVHSPIGLDIKAETPEEIAVSIAAELIKERAELFR